MNYMGKPISHTVHTLLLGAALFATATVKASAAEPWEGDYGKLLQKYVTPSGVKYAEWKKSGEDLVALDEIIVAIEKNGPSRSDKNDQFAYHMNAYNAWVLKLVLYNYPIKSVSDVALNFGFFKRESINVAGKKMSLDSLEKGLIATTYNDPRYHFAINCAARSCPPLSNVPFTGAKVDEQLQALTVAFINTNPEGVQFDASKKSAAVSSLFKWYGDQFIAATPDGTILAYLNQYRTDKLPAETALSFQNYNWELNQAK